MQLEKIHPVRNLSPYFKIADDEAKLSPCSRRQYGCVIVWESSDVNNYVAAANYRLSDCCNGVSCARTRFDTAHGGRVEIGAEVHAETAALIKMGLSSYQVVNVPNVHDAHPVMLLVGRMNGKSIRGRDTYPCHTCALNIKYAGFKYVYVKDDDDTIIPVSIAEIIERRELEWEPN